MATKLKTQKSPRMEQFYKEVAKLVRDNFTKQQDLAHTDYYPYLRVGKKKGK